MGLVDSFRAKLELHRLEQRYARRDKRTTFYSDAKYVDGEYVFSPSPEYSLTTTTTTTTTTPHNTGSSSSNSSGVSNAGKNFPSYGVTAHSSSSLRSKMSLPSLRVSEVFSNTTRGLQKRASRAF